MTTDTALIEKREELKRRLAAGEYKTLVDIFLEWFDRLLQKITRRSKPFPLWRMTVFLSLVINLIFFGAVYVAGDFIIIRDIAESFGLGYGLGILSLLSILTVPVVTIIILNQSVGRVFVLWRDDILDATESAPSLHAFEDWLEKACNRRLHFYLTIFGGLLLGLLVVFMLGTEQGEFVGYGYTFAQIIIAMITVAFFYQGFVVIPLPAMLRRYDLKLFAADPATSELLSRLSGELSTLVYFIAFYSAMATLTIIALGASQTAGIILVLFLWLPIIAMFTLNQTSLSTLVRRAKWKTLNEIQMKVEKLQTSKNFGNQETMDAIKRLMDYHDRVKATRDSALDFRTYLGFFNSLLLPLLAFILGNLDLVLKLFGKKP